MIPINKVLNKYSYIAVHEQTNDLWLSGVRDAVGDFSTPGSPVAEGLSAVATSTILRLLGSTAGVRQTVQD
jgi:hypothetical protein